MITHIVLLNIKPELNKLEILKELERRLLTLNDTIKELHLLEFGVDFNGSELAYDAALYSTFKSKDDLQAYQAGCFPFAASTWSWKCRLAF